MSVSVDNDFARFGAKSYAINKITSVEIREVKDTKGGCAIAAFGLLTLGCTLAALGQVTSNFGGAIGYLLVAALWIHHLYADPEGQAHHLSAIPHHRRVGAAGL